MRLNVFYVFFFCSHFEKYGDITDLYMPKVNKSSLSFPMSDSLKYIASYHLDFLLRIRIPKVIVELDSSPFQVLVNLLLMSSL